MFLCILETIAKAVCGRNPSIGQLFRAVSRVCVLIRECAVLASINFRGDGRLEICLVIALSACSVGCRGYGLGRLSW